MRTHRRRSSPGLKIAIAVMVLAGAASAYVGYTWLTAENPDPNHTHADFAVWVLGEQLDFSNPAYMTGESDDPSSYADAKELRKNLHLHDGLGTVIHRHKPGLTLGDFLTSIGQAASGSCITLDERQFGTIDPGKQTSYDLTYALCETGKFRWMMAVNGVARPFDPGYDFADGDRILLTYGTGDILSPDELGSVSDDACKYSKTCPWRGEPPAENCIADPEVPCTVPVGDL